MAKQYGQYGYENRQKGDNQSRNRWGQPGGEGGDYGRTSEYYGGEGQGDNGRGQGRGEYGQSNYQGGRPNSTQGQDFNDGNEGGREMYGSERERSGYGQPYGQSGGQENYQQRRPQTYGSGGQSNYSSSRYGGSDYASNDYGRNASRYSTPHSQPSEQSDWQRYTDEGYQANDGRSRMTNSRWDRLRGSGEWSNRDNGDFEQAYGQSYGSNDNTLMISSGTYGDRYGQGDQQRYGQSSRGQGDRGSGGYGSSPYGSNQYGSNSGSNQSSSEYYGNSQSGDAYGGGYGQSYRGIGPKGYERSDERIKELVCECLSEDHTIDASNIHVEVKDKEIKLTGNVKDRRQKYAAEELIERKVSGAPVQNELRVKNESQSGQSQSGQGPSYGATQSSASPGSLSGTRTATAKDLEAGKPKAN